MFNKKSSFNIIQDVLYDLVFIALTLFFFLAYIHHVDSSSVYYLKYYSYDLSNTLNLVLGLNDVINMQYNTQKTHFLPRNKEPKFKVILKNGFVQVFDIFNPDFKVSQPVIFADKKTELDAFLDSLIIHNTESSFYGFDSVLCNYLLSKPSLLTEKIRFYSDEKDYVESILEHHYTYSFGYDYADIMSSIFNKNVKSVEQLRENLSIIIKLIKNKNKKIFLFYDSSALSKQLACDMRSDFKDMSFDVVSSLKQQFSDLPQRSSKLEIIINYHSQDEKQDLLNVIASNIFNELSLPTKEELDNYE